MRRTKTETIGTITQLPSGSYRVRWYAVDADDQRKRRAATFATREEAEAHLGSLRRDGRENLDPSAALVVGVNRRSGK